MATEKPLLLPQFAFLPTSLYSPMDLSNPLALPTVLSDPSTIRFHRGSYDQADFGGIDLSKNPQKSSNCYELAFFTLFLPFILLH